MLGGWLFVRGPWPGDVVRSAEFTSGAAGSYRIGDTKEALLASHVMEAIMPNVNACSTGWVYLSSMTEPQRQCLLSSESWEVDDSNVAGLCPQHSDTWGTLSFEAGKLAKVSIRCTRPE